MKGLYIHIPFCESICPYCDFSTWKANTNQHSRWFNVLKLELTQRCLPKTAFQTLYFGGGTPSLISAKLFEEVMVFLMKYLDLFSLIEVTIEVNPNCIDQEKLEVYQKYGVTRVSLGVQSFQNHLLNVLGRKHCRDQILNSLQLLLQFNFQISLDLMFGTPLQKEQDLILDIEEAGQYPISHLSLYGLIIEPQTLFYQQKQRNTLPHIQEELYDIMYLKAVELLEENGLVRYEVSSFARDSLVSIHNQNYWNGFSFLGLGSGAYSFLDECRIGNSKKFATYEKWVINGCNNETADFYEEIDCVTKQREEVWLSLRQAKGLDLQKYKEIIPIDSLDKWVKKGYAVIDNGFFKVCDLGWLYLDDLVIELW